MQTLLIQLMPFAPTLLLASGIYSNRLANASQLITSATQTLELHEDCITIVLD